MPPACHEYSHVADEVVDCGQVTPNHILPSVFTPVFTTKAKGQGPALGLSVSRDIIARHGGKILVSSEENN